MRAVSAPLLLATGLAVGYVAGGDLLGPAAVLAMLVACAQMTLP
jgi:hypothetical protein